MNFLRFIPLFFLLQLRSQACINVPGTSLDGKSTLLFSHPAGDLRRAMDSDPRSMMDLISHESGPDEDPITELEKSGVRKILSGHFDEAIAILTDLEAEFPGRYSTASNLGTAYELHGDLGSALKWIEEGIRRNPESHQGTEWLHAAILKTKILLQDDPDFLNHHHLIELPEAISPRSKLVIQGEEQFALNLQNALHHQLKERLVFVKPTDPIVADLLYSYALLEAHLNSVEPAIELMELSREYGYPKPGQIDQKIEFYQSLIFWRKFRFYMWIALGIALMVTFLVFAYRKKWFFLTLSAYQKAKSAQ
ncbi:hypothetical protein JIN85_01910 [Luteolibacter pohnpeiensis]|uniref:Tetratricopeptide repeat protein n=1 Tax=Luteolibacter pohnpeiensis TaxID=454153 RepID=A0A934S979_9BACT|nr:hypothetical protein [Luteolibacter pohnpeiensis]MBK1881148.1 hypothetical protein [Luteolibacter pohnpeiensis]